MGVSKATLKCLNSETTQIFKNDMSTAFLNIAIIKEGKCLLNKLTKDKKGK